MERWKHYITNSFIFAFPLLLVLMTGCSFLKQAPDVSTTEADVLGGTEGPLPKKLQLHDVPHNPSKQKGSDCAPDSLRMVLNYRGQNIANDQEIVRKLTSRGTGGGTTFRQMQEIAVKDYGLPAFIINNCDLDSLKAAIVNEWPPVVSYRVKGRIYHAVVAVGLERSIDVIRDVDRAFVVSHPPSADRHLPNLVVGQHLTGDTASRYNGSSRGWCGLGTFPLAHVGRVGMNRTGGSLGCRRVVGVILLQDDERTC